MQKLCESCKKKHQTTSFEIDICVWTMYIVQEIGYSCHSLNWYMYKNHVHHIEQYEITFVWNHPMPSNTRQTTHYPNLSFCGFFLGRMVNLYLWISHRISMAKSLWWWLQEVSHGVRFISVESFHSHCSLLVVIVVMHAHVWSNTLAFRSLSLLGAPSSNDAIVFGSHFLMDRIRLWALIGGRMNR